MEKRYDFNEYSEISQDDFDWLHEPGDVEMSTNGMLLHMNSNTDFWHTTYTKPPVVTATGHLFYKPIVSEQNLLVETRFELSAMHEFDQSGLMIYLNSEQWIKTGLQYVDGKYLLSTVVTNGSSDWSTQNHASNIVGIRLYKLGDDIVIEANETRDVWSIVRICRWKRDCNDVSGGMTSSQLKVGLYACAPKGKGGSACFQYVHFKFLEKNRNE